MKKSRILVVDDNQAIRATLKILLSPYFEMIELLASPSTLVSKMETMKPNVVLLDMNFNTDTNTGNEGLFWTSEIKRIQPLCEVVLFTAYADIQLAVEGMRRGAFDFVVKPWDNDKLIKTLQQAAEKAQGTIKKTKTQSSANIIEMFWGSSQQMEMIRHNLGKIAPTDASVLITGENGTGKDVLANVIHQMSRRSDKPMVCVDAGAITDTLFESELFGHVKGAFTDAHTDKVGLFEQASGGTLFLDEIGNIPLHLQSKLLRAIQNRAITKVGDTKLIPIDIRLICATNMNLEQMVRDGKFREDLFYRINTMHLHLPPLRDRVGDIVPFAEMFVNQYNEKYHREIRSISPDACKALENHTWNGNVRELQNCIEKAVILAEGNTLVVSDFQFADPIFDDASSMSLSTLDEAEEQLIRNAMNKHNGNLSMVAKSLNISRPTLYSKLKKYGI